MSKKQKLIEHIHKFVQFEFEHNYENSISFYEEKKKKMKGLKAIESINPLCLSVYENYLAIGYEFG